jgi:hypothetical protein
MQNRQWGRRVDDKGQESPQVMLARIDERTKNMNDKLVAHMVSFETHKVDDEGNFKSVNRLVYIGVGIVVTLQFVGFMLHK